MALSPVLKALADPSRLAVLSRFLLLGRELNVTRVAACCPSHLSVISRHLQALKKAGVLTAEKRGKEVFYRVSARPLARSLRVLAGTLEKTSRTSR